MAQNRFQTLRAGAALLAATALISSCDRRPEDPQARAVDDAARVRAKAIEARTESEAADMAQRAQALKKEAEQAGGYTAKRLETRSDALAREARLVREQGDLQADSVRQAAEAQVKAIEGR